MILLRKLKMRNEIRMQSTDYEFDESIKQVLPGGFKLLLVLFC